MKIEVGKYYSNGKGYKVKILDKPNNNPVFTGITCASDWCGWCEDDEVFFFNENGQQHQDDPKDVTDTNPLNLVAECGKRPCW